MVQRMVGGIDTFPLLAIPFFILAGNLMNTGGVTSRLVDLARVMVGHFTGGLSHAVVVTNMVMAGMSGSGVADAAGTGVILIPAMKRAGYPVPYAAAITAAAGTVGPIIPPSIPFVIYGSLANVSTGRLLLAGAVPGVLMCITLMIFGYVISQSAGTTPPRRGPPAARWPGPSSTPCRPWGCPIIILGGIIGGIMTPTEAAAAGAFYSLFLGMFIYKEIKVSMLPAIITESVVGTAAVVIIMSAAQPFGWVLTFEQAPQQVLAFFDSANLECGRSTWCINTVLLLLGCFMEGMAIMIMAVPVLLPLLAANAHRPHALRGGVRHQHHDRHHHPARGDHHVRGPAPWPRSPSGPFAREMWPFFIALVIALGIITYWPDMVMFLPNLLMPIK